MLISISSVSGGGKTYSALLLAAGLAGKGGRVGFLDTENGRGGMYADSKGITAALPGGYEIDDLFAPFEPKNYAAAIDEFERSGVNVLVIDSFTHEWEGTGGCCDIAENNKLRGMPNWAMAKREHKRLMNRLLSTNMHIILCIRARDKVKMQKNSAGREEVLQIGLQPITEKNVVFEMLISLMLEETTHLAIPLKIPEALAQVFPGGKLITKQDGEAIRQWNQGGRAVEPTETLEKRGRLAASSGMEEYTAFWGRLSTQQKLDLKPIHESLKASAQEVDRVESVAVNQTDDDDFLKSFNQEPQ